MTTVEQLIAQTTNLQIQENRTEDIHDAAEAFLKFDRDGSGFLDVSEVRQAFNDAGHKITGHECRDLLSKWQRASQNEITWAEFVVKFVQLRHQGDIGRTFAENTKEAKGVNRIGSVTKSYHSYPVEERIGFADWCNRVLGKDKDLKHLLPLSIDNDDLFEKCKDGVLLCKLINSAVPDTIDERSINKPKPGKDSVDTFRQTENCNLAIQSAISIGATVVNVGAQDIMEGKGHLILGLIWQIIEIGLMAGVSLEQNPHIAALLEEDEELSDLQRLGPEGILLRWFNFHLRNDKSYEGLPPVTNFKKDLADSVAYIHLLSQIQPEDHMPRISSDHSANNDIERAEKMLRLAEQLECRAFLTPRDVVNKKEKLNLAFIANLFNNHPALIAENIAVINETREEKTYRNWMNSLGVNPRIIRIYNDIRSGVPLYDVMKKISPKVAEKYKIDRNFKPFTAMMSKIGNCQRCVDMGKEMGFKLTGIEGKDIYDEHSTFVLALLSQMMRAYTTKVLQDLGDGKPVTDNDILKWANDKLASEHQISSFKDQKISTSLPIYRLINAIAPGTIDFSVVNTSRPDMMKEEDKYSNARYALSQSRKLGATVYALPDDIIEVKQKMLVTLFAALMVLDKTKN